MKKRLQEIDLKDRPLIIKTYWIGSGPIINIYSPEPKKEN